MLNMMMVTSQMVDLEHTVAFHKPILAAIEGRDAASASRLMTAHLQDAADLLSLGREQEFARTLRDHVTSVADGVQKSGQTHKVRLGGCGRRVAGRETLLP